MMKELVIALAGLGLLAAGVFAPDILDAIVDGRPTELQVAVGTAIPLVLGSLLLYLVIREWRVRYLIR